MKEKGKRKGVAYFIRIGENVDKRVRDLGGGKVRISGFVVKAIQGRHHWAVLPGGHRRGGTNQLGIDAESD